MSDQSEISVAVIGAGIGDQAALTHAARDTRYVHYNVAMPAKTQPFSIRLGEQANLLVEDEVRRSGRSRSVVVGELAEEAAKTRLHPGVAFRGRPRRAWVIGSGLDVWEIIELLGCYADDGESLAAIEGERVTHTAVVAAAATAV